MAVRLVCDVCGTEHGREEAQRDRGWRAVSLPQKDKSSGDWMWYPSANSQVDICRECWQAIASAVAAVVIARGK